MFAFCHPAVFFDSQRFVCGPLSESRSQKGLDIQELRLMDKILYYRNDLKQWKVPCVLKSRQCKVL